jgi:hypothetical protein
MILTLTCIKMGSEFPRAISQDGYLTKDLVPVSRLFVESVVYELDKVRLQHGDCIIQLVPSFRAARMVDDPTRFVFMTFSKELSHQDLAIIFEEILFADGIEIDKHRR